MSEPAISEYWRLCDELTVQQAVLLIVGIDPASEAAECEHWKPQERPRGYDPVKQALSAALRKGAIAGTNALVEIHDINGCPIDAYPDTTDVYASTVEAASLVQWLRSRGMNTGFFFPQEDSSSKEPDYLNPNHPRYSKKLAAAVQVWLAMEDENLRRGKGAIKAMGGWLESRYKEFGLVYPSDGRNGKSEYKKGDRNDGAITQVAKIANWNPDGGTPPTP